MTERRVVRSAAALVIGNELLSGKVPESNVHCLAQTLRALGIRLGRVVMVPDELESIAHEIRVLSAEHEALFTSGGIGPTHDDVTIDAVAHAFGVPVHIHPEMEALLRKSYGDACTESHLRMARVPTGAELATTMEVQWPTVVMRNVWVLPGVPEIFRMKLSVVRERLCGPVSFISRAVYTQMDEATLKPVLDDLVARFPATEIGSYPKWFDESYKTKVTLDAQSPEEAQRALDALLARLPAGEPQRVD